MLSQALKGGAALSCTSTVGLASSQLSSALLDTDCGSQTALCGLESGLHIVDDALDTPKYSSKEPQHHQDDDEEDAGSEEEPFWAVGHSSSQADSQTSPFSSELGQHSSIDALCRSFVASSLTHRPPMVQDSNNSSSISGMDIAAAAQHHNSAATGAFPANMVARSCPKPILMSRRSRQGSLTTNQDELTVFIPPHELSLLDPASVSESLCRKGSAAIRLRSGVLRRTGYLEGHTETLRPQTSITTFKQ